jgi:hypothetical protein
MTTRKAVSEAVTVIGRGYYLLHFIRLPRRKTATSVLFLQILNGESVEFVCLVTVNEVVNQSYHNAASDDVA